MRRPIRASHVLPSARIFRVVSGPPKTRFLELKQHLPCFRDCENLKSIPTVISLVNGRRRAFLSGYSWRRSFSGGGLLFTGLRLPLAPLFLRRWLFLPGLLLLLLAFLFPGPP